MTNITRVLAGLLWLSVCGWLTAQPVAVRNDVPRIGQQEVIMMRHAWLEAGTYPDWYEASVTGVWPWFERLGARILGDFQIVYPQGDNPFPDRDQALRFARYASHEHWRATRSGAAAGDTGGATALAGNGPLADDSAAGLASRRQHSLGSRGGVFLSGYLAPTRPLYMPGLDEDLQSADGLVAVRPDRPQAGEALLVLEYRQIDKGRFEEFHTITASKAWPYLEKIGVRPVGQWRVVYLPGGSVEENDSYDEVYSLSHYASYEHFLAVRDDAVSLGGNGPDYAALSTAYEQLGEFTRSTSTEFLRGALYGSPPLYTPPAGAQ